MVEKEYILLYSHYFHVSILSLLKLTANYVTNNEIW